MRNKYLIIVISWLMVLLTIIIIYNFSGETAKESTETSGGLINSILELFLPKEEITEELVTKFQNPFRNRCGRVDYQRSRGYLFGEKLCTEYPHSPLHAGEHHQ